MTSASLPRRRVAASGFLLNMVWEFGQCLFLYDMWSWGVWGATVWMWAAIIGDVGIVLGGSALAQSVVGPATPARMNGQETMECMGAMGATGWAMWLFWGLLTVLVMWSLYRLFATSRTEAPARDAPLEALQPDADDCCVFCTHGSAPCPPVQRNGHCC